MVAAAIASVRVQSDGHVWKGEMREGPLRIDVWRGVEWIGQWAWEKGAFGSRRAGHRRLPETAQIAVRDAVHKLDMGAYIRKDGV